MQACVAATVCIFFHYVCIAPPHLCVALCSNRQTPGSPDGALANTGRVLATLRVVRARRGGKPREVYILRVCVNTLVHE